MSPEERVKTCCVIKCTNTSSNSKVNFFGFPRVQRRSYQRNRWVQAIKNENGRWWMPSAQNSFVCSDHFLNGHPSANSQDTDYAPSVFINTKKAEIIKSRAVSVKKFGLEYIKHDALLEKPSRANASNDQRKCAYVKLAAAVGIPVTMVRAWERRFRDYIDEKMADPPDKRKPSADGKPHWLTMVANRLFANPMHRLGARGDTSAVSPSGVVAALCAAARERGSLCSTALYNHVRRKLRLSSAVNDLHAVWVSAQRVSLQQVLVAGRAGDAAHAAPPPAAAAVADLVLLHTDVDIVTDESVTLYEESAALHTLWQLIQRHRLEDAAPAKSRVRAQRWTRAHRTYLESGRTVSLVVLQRRWYELKLQARVRLAMHWRRPAAPQIFDDVSPAPGPAPDPAPVPTPTPNELYPRPAPLHIAILKRYPHIATGNFMSWRQQVLDGTIVTEPLEEENDVKETQSNNNEQSTDTTDTSDDAAVKQLYPNMSKVEQPTFDEPMVEQRPDNDLLEEENDVKETKINFFEQSTDITDTGHDAAIKRLYPNMSKVEQPTVDEIKKEETFYDVPLIDQSTAYDQLAAHTIDNVPLAEESMVHEVKVEQTIDSGPLTDNHVTEQTTDIGLLAAQSTVYEPKIEQATDLFINQSTVCTLAESPVGHAGYAATADIPDMLDTPDTQGGTDILSEQIHRTEDKSNEVIQVKRAYSSDTDTDSEDNLVIDECSNKIPCSFKREPVPHSETHSLDTVSLHAALGNIAPTIEVLHMIDPNTVKTEILFESDEDDFEPCNELDNAEIELDAKQEVSFISNRIMYADEEPVSCDVKSDDDVTDRMDWEDGQKMDDPVNVTPTIDPKLLMDTKVRLFRIDEIRAWIKNVRKDNSIRVSRIHRRYYTPKTLNKCNNTKQNTQSKQRTLNTRLDVELRTSARLSTTTPTTTTINETQEIRVDKSCLDKVANTHNIRQLCRNLKRELIEEQLELLEDETPNKKAKIELDSDDEKPLLVLREGKPPRETTDETEDKVAREMVEESSSDDELLNDDMFSKLRGEERKRGRGKNHAASTIEWSSDFAPALGRVAKRVSLPDIEQVRRYNSSMLIAQVAPITSTVGSCGDDALLAGQAPGDAAADDTPEAWRALDLPADDELQAALDDLTAAPAAEAVLERSHCCAARRHREVNDTRRRIGLAEIPLHNHPDGVCTCCCTHLSDADARHRLDQQLRALHEDIEQMLRKSSGGRIQTKPAQKHSRSPSPARPSTSATAAASTHKQATKDAPSNTATVAKGPKAKPATYTNRSKQSRSRARATPAPAPAPPAPPVNDYEEWQRQKNMNAQYFHINSNISFKKEKSTTVQGTAVQSTMAQASSVQSTTVQTVTKQNTNTQSASPQQNVVKPGLMPYIRQSRLVTPLEEPPRARRADPVPPLRRTRPVNIAPKLAGSNLVQHNIVVGQPATTTEGPKNLTIPITNSYQSLAIGPRRMNLTTEQVPEPNSQPVQVMRVNRAPPAPASAPSAPAPAPSAPAPAPSAPVPSAPVPARSVPAPAPPAPPVNDYEEWQRQKNMNAQYFHINSNVSSKKNKNTTAKGTAKQSANAQGTAKQSTPAQGTAVQSTPAQGTAVQSTPAQGTAVQSTPAQGTAVQSTPAQGTAVQSTPAQDTAVKSTIAEDTSKPVSILEEYSRTLNTEPVNNTPVLNALSLRVPSGPQGPKTTILMALTLPSDDVIKQTINRLYATDTVDLTEEPELSSKSVITKTDSKQKQTTIPIDLVGALKKIMNPVNKKKTSRSLLKNLTATKSGKSQTTTTTSLDKPPAAVATRDTAPKIMCLSNILRDGDVIEIDDTDSNNSNSSDGNQSNHSNKSSILINKSSNPAVYTNKITTSTADESSNQAATNSTEAVSDTNTSTEAVSKTNERSSQANRKKSSNQASEDKDKRFQKLSKTKRRSKEKCNNRLAKPAVFKKSNVSVEAVISNSVARPCSRIPVLTSLTDGSRRCPARFASVAAMTDFMATLRRAAAQADKEVYCHKWSAIEQPVSALPCGGTLLCVDGSRPPLVLPALVRRDQRDQRDRRDRATPHARAHLVLTDADPPCALPTYWTLAAFGQMARVIPDELVSTDAPHAADAPDANEVESRGGGARWCAARNEWVTPKEDRKICEKNHNFKILTAFCSADGIRQAARAGASLLLLSVLRARVVVLTLQREQRNGVVRHRASADVEEELLRELEGLLDEAEIDEQLGGRADIIGQ